MTKGDRTMDIGFKRYNSGREESSLCYRAACRCSVDLVQPYYERLMFGDTNLSKKTT